MSLGELMTSKAVGAEALESQPFPGRQSPAAEAWKAVHPQFCFWEWEEGQLGSSAVLYFSWGKFSNETPQDVEKFKAPYWPVVHQTTKAKMEGTGYQSVNYNFPVLCRYLNKRWKEQS